MNENRAMRKFLSSVHMGSAIIKELDRHSENLATKRIWMEILNSMADHENSLVNILRDLNVNTSVKLTCREKMSIWMTKMRMKMKDEFEIVLLGIEAIQMGITGALQFLYDHHRVNYKFINVAIEVVEDYDNFLTKLKLYAQDHLNVDKWKEKKTPNVEIEE